MATARQVSLGDSAAAPSPFHVGEQAVQERIGVRERIERMGQRMMRDSLPPDYREFLQELPFLVVGSADPAGSLWASLLIGESGFVQTPTARNVAVRAQPLPGDPLGGNLRAAAPLGLLGIELATRSRIRINGHIARVSDDTFDLGVEQSFGNCQQYIQSRVGVFADPKARKPPSAEGAELSPAARPVARTHRHCVHRHQLARYATRRRRGLDVSHRGGRPGFIRTETVTGTSVLTLPDFRGNFMFNTLGNLEVNPHAGFLALDFDTGEVLSLTGTARVIWDGPAVEAFEGAQRLLEFSVQSGWLWRDILSQWSEPEQSPQLRGTGTWHNEPR